MKQRRELKKRKRKKTKKPITLSTKRILIPGYFEKDGGKATYHKNIYDSYYKQYKGQFDASDNDIEDECEDEYDSMIADPLNVAVVKVTRAFYMRSTTGNHDKINTLTNQLSIIRLFQTLPTYSEEELNGALTSYDKYPYMEFYGYSSTFKTIFYFLKAKEIYINTRLVPKDVEDELHISINNFTEEQILNYLTYVSEATQRCLNDLIDHFFDHLEYLSPSEYCSLKEKGVITGLRALPGIITDFRSTPAPEISDSDQTQPPEQAVAFNDAPPKSSKRVQFDFLKTPDVATNKDKENMLNKQVAIDINGEKTESVNSFFSKN